jgi:lysozyme family protein
LVDGDPPPVERDGSVGGLRFDAEEREARGRELRAAQDLARRRRRQTILASAVAVIILALGGAATWMFSELAATRGSQVAQLEYENSVLSRLLRQEYQQRFDAAKVFPARQEVVAQSVRKILGNRARYERITKSMTMPWYFLAIIHGMEADFRFDSHLHNGDPLTGRTVRVPAGRPTRGAPPFTWEESAMDAITVNRYDKWNDWSIAGMLVAITAWAIGLMASTRPMSGHAPLRCECRIQAMRCRGNAQRTDRDRLGVAAGGSEIGCPATRAWTLPVSES